MQRKLSNKPNTCMTTIEEEYEKLDKEFQDFLDAYLKEIGKTRFTITDPEWDVMLEKFELWMNEKESNTDEKERNDTL